MRAESSDEQLATAWQGGDASAGTDLLRRYVRPLERYFYTKVGGDEVEDLRQEALRRVASSMASFRHQSSFRTYLYRIAHRTLCDHLRYRTSGRGRRDTATCSLEQLHGAMDFTPALDDDLRDLIAAMRTLSADDQILFELRHVEGLSYQEISQVTGAGCALATLRARLHGIMKLLRSRLGEHDEPLRGHPIIHEPLDVGATLRRLRYTLDVLVKLSSVARRHQAVEEESEVLVPLHP